VYESGDTPKMWHRIESQHGPVLGTNDFSGKGEGFLTKSLERERLPVLRQADALEGGDEIVGKPHNFQVQSVCHGGRVCYVLDLTAEAQNKYLVKGKLCVDANNFGTVRLDGSTAVAFRCGWHSTVCGGLRRVEGHRLPSRTWSVSSGLLVGTSELETQYTEYRILDSHTLAAGTAG
jgi:hypothetical protein